MKPEAILDIECYSNYFLVGFMRLSDDRIIAFERTVDQELDKKSILEILKKYEVITFNGEKYDKPMLRLALTGVTNSVLKEANDALIANMNRHQFSKEYRLPEFAMDHIDIMEVAPSPGQVSLKTYMGRIHAKRIMDLPVSPDVRLSPEQMKLIRDVYWPNDLHGTKLIYQKLKSEIDLRRVMSTRYRVDLRSKSDAQIAEEVLKVELTRLMGRKPQRPTVKELYFDYDAPDFLDMSDPRLKHVLEVVTKNKFSLNGAGRVEMPKALLDLSIKIGRSVYRMGIGGLHSSESGATHRADKGWLLADWDVTSYYPSTIRVCNLEPPHLKGYFLPLFSGIIDERVLAKHTAETLEELERSEEQEIQYKEAKTEAGSKKTVLNGTFGKLGSPYSILFAPKLMIQVTLTGQLALLMLIASLEERGIHVVSANTDGIVCKCPVSRESTMIEMIRRWEASTGYTMERSDYSGLFSRDVNNYIAITTKGKAKVKGVFTGTNLKKNPQNEICSLAVVEFLKSGKPMEETIAECKDITKFVTIRKVNGGALKGKEMIGKVIRWYYAVGERGTINYANNNNVVPMTQGAKPLMELPDEFPTDVNYSWYIAEAEKLLSAVGASTRGQQSFDF